MSALLLWAAITAVPEVRVAVRPSGAAATCTARDASGGRSAAPPEPAAVPNQWTWRPRAGDTLACEAPGFEPLDLDSARVAARPEITLELQPARTVTVVTPGG